jgi:hypothetical protein
MPDSVIAQEPRDRTVSQSITSDLLATAQRMLSAGCDFEAKILMNLAEDMLRTIPNCCPSFPPDPREFEKSLTAAPGSAD